MHDNFGDINSFIYPLNTPLNSISVAYTSLHQSITYGDLFNIKFHYDLCLVLHLKDEKLQI